MAVTAVFDVDGMTEAQYATIIERLAGLGLQHPEGRVVHTASPRPGGWIVVDVWDGETSFGKFGSTLGPILGELGLHVEPKVLPTHALVVDPVRRGIAV